MRECVLWNCVSVRECLLERSAFLCVNVFFMEVCFVRECLYDGNVFSTGGVEEKQTYIASNVLGHEVLQFSVW